MKNQIAKGSYLAPETEVIDVLIEDVVCASVETQAQFSGFGNEEDM